MSTDPSTPENDANLSGLGRALLESKEGSKPSGPWVPPTAEELGKLLPEYEIVKMLGRGGMGAVYMGRQKSLDRPVAIKILSNTLDEADASFAERFKNEARAMGKLNHPGIVAVHDFGETAGGLLYIVMEYVEGTDVARMIAKEGRLHTEHAMAITAHVCDALAYAHDRGIIHRDIKPANIMVGYDGVVKVADFGLAKMTHSNASGLTQSGMAMGTLHYMAPEALMLGSAVDHRADIYAVGVMLYQMLTGKIPQGMFKLPSLQIPGLDPRYDAIIAKGIMEDREARYQSVSEMRRDLDGILTQPVVKVEAEVSQAPAALPTQARPQRPGGQPYRPPQPAVQPQMVVKSSAGLVWATLLVLAVFGSIAWLVLDQPGGKQSAVAEESPAIEVPMAPVTVKTTTAANQPTSGTFDLMNIAEWQRQGDAEWEIEDGAFVTRPSPQGHLYRTLGFDDFELTGEARASAEGNGGIWFCAASMDLGNPGGYEFQICGSVASGGKSKTGSLLIGRALISILDSEVPDNSWVTFRIRREGSTLQGWLDGRPTFSTTLLPESERALGRIIALQRWDKAGTVSYRKLQVITLPTTSPSATSSVVPTPVPTAPAVAGDSGFIDLLSPAEAGNWKQSGVGGITIENGVGTTWAGPRDQGPWGVHWYAKRTFSDFVLQVEFRAVQPGFASALHLRFANPGNDARIVGKTGFKIRISDAPRVFDSDAAESDAQVEIPSALVKPAGEWNTMEIAVTGQNYVVTLNGQIVNRFIGNRLAEGYIGLQNFNFLSKEGLSQRKAIQKTTSIGPVQFRNVRIKDLKASASVPSLPKAPASSESVPSVGATPAIPTAAITLTSATKDKPFVNSLGMKFVPVPGTKVLMCIHETRKSDFRAYADASSISKRGWESINVDGEEIQYPEDHPVSAITFQGAEGFCAWLSQKEGNRYRLPTDREWSMAVGIGSSEPENTPPALLHDKTPGVYPWGRDATPPAGSGNFADLTMEQKFPRLKTIPGFTDGYATTAPVMSFKANNLGIHDLAGNVWEWCAEWWDEASQERVIRGGSWDSKGALLGASWRGHTRSNVSHSYLKAYSRGFRVVLELP